MKDNDATDLVNQCMLALDAKNENRITKGKEKLSYSRHSLFFTKSIHAYIGTVENTLDLLYLCSCSNFCNNFL